MKLSKDKFYFLFFSVFVFGCFSKKSDTELKDSTVIIQSMSQSNVDTLGDEENSFLGVDIDTSIYRIERTIDTTFLIGQDVINVKILAKFDSSRVINIPKKYLELVRINNFSTYDTWFKVLVTKNSKVVIDTSLSKFDFNALADSSLQLYGVLISPNIDIHKDSLYIGFSYSIPLSDVGVYAPIALKFYE